MWQLLLIAAIVGIWLFIRWARKQPKQKQFQAVAILVALILLGLVVTGKAHWLFAVLAAMAPMLRRLLGMLSYMPLLKRLFVQFRNSRPDATANQHSTVATDYVSMRLDHATGIMSGLIKKGTHAGQELENLSCDELIELYKEYSHLDTDSARLLEAYLDRAHQHTWREKVDVSTAGASLDANMTAQEACNVLGLDGDATREDIIGAHRKLMQKIHPDRGGNDYLASKINQAKDLLLKQQA